MIAAARHPAALGGDRRHLHVVTKLIVQGWPKAKLRDLLPDRMLASHPEIYVGEPLTLSTSPAAASLVA